MTSTLNTPKQLDWVMAEALLHQRSAVEVSFGIKNLVINIVNDMFSFLGMRQLL